MLEVNCRSFLSEFNASKFVVYLALFFFSITLALKLDNVFNYSFYAAFSPFKLEIQGSQIDKQLSWLLLFSPLFILSFFCMIVAVWAIRHDRTFDFELMFSVNIIQFVFISFKLDGALNWSWMIVFVPIWILFSLCFIGTFYSLTLAIFVGRSSNLANLHRRSHFFNAITHMLLTIPLLVFFIFIADKFDAMETGLTRHGDMPFTIIICPLLISLFVCILMSFGSKSGNTWWFGMRKPFFSYTFDAFPCLQQYANISYRFGAEATDGPVQQPRPRNVVGNLSPSNSNHSEQVQMIRNDDRVIIKMGQQYLCSIESPDYFGITCHWFIAVDDRMKTFYDLLNVSPTATPSEIKQGYFESLRLNHPDRGATDLEVFAQIQKAYETLKDLDKRNKYNLWLEEQRLRSDENTGIIDEFYWNTCQKAGEEEENLDFLPNCRCCGDFYLIEKEDLNKIIDFAVFDCSSCSVKLKMNPPIKILVLGDPDVGKTTFVNILCNDHDKPLTSTVGCNIEVFYHVYSAGTPKESTEIIELWDIGGAFLHRQTAREVFMDDAVGVIFVHDLSNSKSEENLMQWATLLYEPSASEKKKLPQPLSFATDFATTQQLPTLFVGTHLDLHPNRNHTDASLAKIRFQPLTFGLHLDCRKSLFPGSTQRLQINKFFDAVVDYTRTLQKQTDTANMGGYNSYHRRRVFT
uniref:Uncharacterized protein n=1 Tax=Panagrolaimus sp. JU765 TaxID=591449 RepID=A0AC34RG35_9BILA